MSAKWVRSQAWDKQNLNGALTPVRWVVHSLSTITLAVILLIGVAVYGILASVPIGLIALAPTYLIYGLTLVITVGVVAGLPVWALWRAGKGWSFGTRFVVSVVIGLVLVLVGAWAWYAVGWPVLRYDESTGRGLRLFAGFVEQYKAVSVRRTPALEMTELEFYGWWPLKALLFLFVLNMTVATVRRIEFNLPNLGVLTVHTGIVVLGLGAAVYSVAKQEGDVLLMAGPPNPADKAGAPTLGEMETGFFDNTRVVLRARQVRTADERIKLNLPPEMDWDQRPLVGLPRYNDYNLEAVSNLNGIAQADDQGRTLSVPVPSRSVEGAKLVDGDIRFRVVGYAAAAELKPAWSEVKAVPGGPQPPDQPVRYVDMLTSLGADRQELPDGKQRVLQTMGLMPTVPSERVVEMARVLGIEYTRGMSDERWTQLTAAIPMPSDPMKTPVGGLIVDIPGQGISRMYPVEPGSTISVGGYTLEFASLSPRPPFPIITPGYEGASCSVAVIHVTPPAAAPGAPEAKAYDRYIYSRFPELSQDLSATERNARGMPVRTAASKDITLTFIDASIIQVHMDERPDGTVRGFVRLPMPKGMSVLLFDGLKTGDSLPVGPQFSLRLGQTLPSVERVKVPESIIGPERERDLGTHKQAAIAVEVSTSGGGDAKPYSTVAWLPFQLYTSERASGGPTSVKLPDGREVEIAFGRLWHPLPGMALQLADFEMFPYPHSTQPQDFRSQLLVTKFDRAGNVVATEERATSLNEPLLESPFVWDSGRNALANSAAWLGNLLGDTRFKFSQSGWDSGGWEQTKAQADAGQLKRPYGRFTILGVGNNPGIKIIALGAILTCTGIPWAFYIKPVIMKRRKAALAKAAAEGKLPARAAKGTPVPQPVLVQSAMEVKP